MEMKKIVANIFGRKNGYCEGCYRMAELQRTKVSNYSGHPSYKYLCKACIALERFKRY